MKNPLKYAGFTLLELLVTVAIAAILLAVAVPSLRDTQQNTSVRGHHKEMLTTLAYARSEAISRSRPVAVCSSADGSSCGGTWNDGWIVFVDDDRSGTEGDTDAGEELLRVYEYTGTNTVFVVDPFDAFDDLDFLRWNHRGFSSDEQSALIVVCGADGETDVARGLMVSVSGRAIATQDTDADNVDNLFFENDDGTTVGELSCSY